MDLSGLRQQILSGNKTASEKAELFLLERNINELSKDEWRELIAGVPEDVKKEIGTLKSGGTQGFALKIDALASLNLFQHMGNDVIMRSGPSWFLSLGMHALQLV